MRDCLLDLVQHTYDLGCIDLIKIVGDENTTQIEGLAEDLTKDELIKVLTGIKNNYIDQYKYLLSLDNIELNFTEDALDQLAENTMSLKTGARGLHTEIERVLMPHMFHTKKYRDNKVLNINIDRKQILEPTVIV